MQFIITDQICGNDKKSKKSMTLSDNLQFSPFTTNVYVQSCPYMSPIVFNPSQLVV